MQIGLLAEEAPVKARYESVPVYRVSLVRESKMKVEQAQFRSSVQVAGMLRDYLEGADREHFVVMMLDRKNRLIGINTVSIGSLTASVVHPREVWKPAILSNAAAVIFGHNHPSGDAQPSQEDMTLTKRLVEAGKLLGIQTLDHVIIGDGTESYFSFADEGQL
jgi:DNA repair protein RadC